MLKPIYTRLFEIFTIFFFNYTTPTEIYTLSLHDALPISNSISIYGRRRMYFGEDTACALKSAAAIRSEEHTSELQSRQYLVCRLLLEKKKISERYQLHS